MQETKDWTGNKNSIFKTLGASNHVESEREKNDYYATEPKAVAALLENESFNNCIWECACGEGHISKMLEASGYEVKSTDLIYRGYGQPEPLDFLADNIETFDGDIVTNPPYKFALEFCEKALSTIQTGNKLAMFLKLTFLEGKKRKTFFKQNPPARIYVFSQRVKCAKNGEFENIGSSAVCYAWFIWEKRF